jgi:hypothetical protein
MIPITPGIKVGELLDNHPQLESVLLQLSPDFASLKCPKLRKTIGKVASLQQVAAIGNIKVEELVNRLRKEVGQEPLFGESTDSDYLVNTPPSWLDLSKIAIRFDAGKIILSGGSPMNHILEQTKHLKEGEIYEFTTPFVPAPMIDMLNAKGFMVVSMKKAKGIANWVRKP